jgi:purine-cytosine permease-like protein
MPALPETSAENEPLAQRFSQDAPLIAGVGIEFHGLDVIPPGERTTKASGLFWPWFGANVNVLGLSFGAFLLSFGISFWQGLLVGVIGGILSFAFVGLVAIGSKRSSAPTMMVSRTIFGVNGNRLVSFISWVQAVGWETILTTLAVLATYTIISQIASVDETITEAIALVVIAIVVVLAGIYGYSLVMRLELAISVVIGLLTIVFVVLAFNHVNFSALGSTPNGDLPQVVGALCFIMVGFGLGWTAIAGDYARYVPRQASGAAVAFWTTVGASLPCTLMLIFGLLLAGSSTDLSNAIAANPVGALATILPTWFMFPFLVVAVTGMIATATLEIYSSGLALLAVGLPVRRPVAAGIDGIVMILGSIYIIFIQQSFIATFEAFLTTVGVPIAVWCGIFLADILMRRKEYVERDFYSERGRYGSVSWGSVILLIVGTVIGWGLITNGSVNFLSWQGYLLQFGLGGVNGTWAFSNLGVVVGLIVGFAGYFAVGPRVIRRQEAAPIEPTATPAFAAPRA